MSGDDRTPGRRSEQRRAPNAPHATRARARAEARAGNGNTARALFGISQEEHAENARTFRERWGIGGGNGQTTAPARSSDGAVPNSATPSPAGSTVGSPQQPRSGEEEVPNTPQTRRPR